MSIDERTHRLLEKLSKTIKKREESFGKAPVGFVFMQNEVSV